MVARVEIVLLIETTDVFNVETSNVLLLIFVRCEANVLLVDVIKFVRLLVLVFNDPRCDVKVVFVFKITLFKAVCVAVLIVFKGW